MNGIQYWECKKHERQAGLLNGEADAGPATVKITDAKRSRREDAGRSGWKGPGTLWIAEAEDPLRKS
ncbi:MAG: hypothetical protein ACYC5X_12205 [Syntrophales bacterium]